MVLNLRQKRGSLIQRCGSFRELILRRLKQILNGRNGLELGERRIGIAGLESGDQLVRLVQTSLHRRDTLLCLFGKRRGLGKLLLGFGEKVSNGRHRLQLLKRGVVVAGLKCGHRLIGLFESLLDLRQCRGRLGNESSGLRKLILCFRQ